MLRLAFWSYPISAKGAVIVLPRCDTEANTPRATRGAARRGARVAFRTTWFSVKRSSVLAQGSERGARSVEDGDQARPFPSIDAHAVGASLVEAALARLGDRRLTPEEQATIVKATRSPRKVEWPEWWKKAELMASSRRSRERQINDAE